MTQVPAVPWAWVDEHVYAAIRGCSVKTLQRERRLNIGCPFRRISGTSIRYKLGDVMAFLESHPAAAALTCEQGRAAHRAVLATFRLDRVEQSCFETAQ